MDQQGKRHGQTNPEGTHEQCLPERNHRVLAAYDREVEKQQEENDSVKDNPEPYVHGRNSVRVSLKDQDAEGSNGFGRSLTCISSMRRTKWGWFWRGFMLPIISGQV